MREGARASGRYGVSCYGADGRLKWRARIGNLVTIEGKNDALDKYLAGSGYSAAFFLGLISAQGFVAIAASDTAGEINGANGWREAAAAYVPNYSQSARPAATWAAASGGSKSLASEAQFSITTAGTVKGCFLATSPTKDGTSDVLYSAGLFDEGDQDVVYGDVLRVSYSAEL